MGANFLAQLINLASRLILVPLFLGAWGVEVYGEWLLLSSLAAYVSLTELGGTTYIANRLTQAYARQDVEMFRGLFQTGLALFLLIPFGGFVIFLFMILLVPPESYLPIVETDHHVVLWVLGILTFQFVCSLPLGILFGAYRAVGLLPWGVMLSNLILLLQMVMVAGGLWVGAGMVWIACFHVIPYLVFGIISAIDLHARFPQHCVLSLGNARYGLARGFFVPSLHFFGIQMAQLISLQGIVLVVGIILGPGQAVIFTTLRTLGSLIVHVLSLTSGSAWPEMTRLDAQGNIKKLQSLFRAILRSTMVVSSVLVVILHFFGSNIYHIWLGDSVEFSQKLMDLFLIYSLVQTFWRSYGNLLMAINVHETMSKVLFVSSMLTLVFTGVGGMYFELTGVVWGMVMAEVLLPMWVVACLAWNYNVGFSMRLYLGELMPIGGALILMVLLPWSIPVVLMALGLWWVRCLPDSFPILSRVSGYKISISQRK